MRQPSSKPRKSLGQVEFLGIVLLQMLLLLIVGTGTAGQQPESEVSPARLRATIRDSATGKPVACSVRITTASGNVIVENKSYADGFRCAGSFDLLLPPGKTRIQISRGFETVAIEEEVQLAPAEETQLTYSLEKRVDLRKLGWHSGDSHAHMIHGERDVEIDFDYAALAARAEDLQLLSLSHDWIIPNATPEQLQTEFDRVSSPDCLLTWNLEAPKNYYRGDAGRCMGHGWTLGIRGRTPGDKNAIPLILDASAHDYEVEKPSFANFETHALIHSLGGYSFYTHPFRWWWGPWGGQGGYPRQERMRVSNMAVELPLDTLLGPTYDGIDVLTTAGEAEANERAFRLWMMLLNQGYRVAATASSDTTFDRPGGGRPGSARTYTYLPERFSLQAVSRATAAGATFATNGPLLVTHLDGKPPGTSFPADGIPRKLSVQAWASGQDSDGLKVVEIFRNGQPFRRDEISEPTFSYHSDLEVAETTSAWYCVRVLGGNRKTQTAISGAFFLDPAAYQAPEPVHPRIRVRIEDAQTGTPLSGIITEVQHLGPLGQPGPTHMIETGEYTLQVPGTVRLQAEVDGYLPMILSPLFDSPELISRVTGLTDDELGNWKTFEGIREMLSHLTLRFRLERAQ